MDSGTLPPITSQPNSGYGLGSSPPGAPGSGGEVTVRNLTNTSEDCAFAGRLCVEGFRSKMVHATSEEALPKLMKGFGKMFETQDPGFFENYYIAEYRNEKAGLMVVKYHDTPPEKLMCMIITLTIPVPKQTCMVDCIAVEDKFRGKGIGKILLDRAEFDAKKRNCNTMMLYVMTTNRAVHLYERQGYEIKGSKCCCMKCATGESVRYQFLLSASSAH
ncbi:hypothetical protein FSP39_015792 [Pinctada imbricata]|uniref:N-acetyltransferase domain-containing protein n=1 Tax=Pinctada imbricata TaxID=66713 RepID=A0AA88YB94_PINIB|nr:hypothetical protein FSP39_015792 [Pinctada imbricata]